MPGNLVIGVDVGGTKVLAGLVDREGTVRRTVEMPTTQASRDDLLREATSLVESLLDKDVVAVGFGVPARVDQRTGFVYEAVNAPIGGITLRSEMEQRLGLPIGVENDANAAAYAEYRLGVGRDVDRMVMLTLGTGVGGGVVLDGALYRGWAELGHMVIVEDGEPCPGNCTGLGHVEAYCSGTAANRLAERVLGPGANAHDLVARKHPALLEVGHHLGVAIGSLVNIFNPELLAIGGGFGVAAFDLLLPAARPAVLREALAPGGANLTIGVAELGAEAGLIGAGLVAFDAVA
jgi:glucokinase